MTAIDGNTLDGTSANTLTTMHRRGTVPGVCAARDIAWPPGRRWWRPAGCPAPDRFGAVRPFRPGITVLELR